MCNNSAGKVDCFYLVIGQTAQNVQVSTAAVTYTCPAHPEVVQDHPGNCPKCGMKLVEKTNNPALDIPRAKDSTDLKRNDMKMMRDTTSMKQEKMKI